MRDIRNNAIKVLFFDGGNVLFNFPENRDARIVSILENHGFNRELVYKAIYEADVIFNSSGNQVYVRTWSQEKSLWQKYYNTIAIRLGKDGKELSDELFHTCHFVNHCSLYPEVMSFLRWASRYFRLAVISNGPPSMNWVFDRLLIRCFFESIVLSSHVGHRKPDSYIFSYALQRMKCDPSEAIFIDDKIENIRAAKALSIQGYFLFRDDSNDCDIRDLLQLKQLLINSHNLSKERF